MRYINKKNYEVVGERDQFKCQFPMVEGLCWPYKDPNDDELRGLVCHRAPAQVHHRLYRSHNGPDTRNNLICLCNKHHIWSHQNPQEATEKGVSIVMKFLTDECFTENCIPPNIVEEPYLGEESW